MNCEIPSNATGLLANYHVNQGFDGVTNTVTSLTDASGNSNTGTLTNFALTGATSNWIAPGGVISGSVTPASLPVVTASPSNTTICNSQSAVLNGGGAVTYTWTNGVIDATAFTPTATASYTVIGSSAVGCTNSAVATVSVNNCTAAEALNFDGVDDYVAISSNAALSMTNSITMETWVKTSGLPTGEQYICTKSNDSYYMGLNVSGNVGRVSFYLNNVSPGWLFSNSNTVNDDNWHHIAATYDGVIMKLYIDGVLDNSAILSGSITTGPNNVDLGSRNGAQFLQGSLDEFRIWDIARTQCEINEYKNCEIPSATTGLVANYHFNQGFDGVTNTVTTLADASGNSNTGTLTNFALSGTTSNWIAPGAVVSGSIAPASLNPVVSSSITNSIICDGQSTTLNAGGADTYNWSGGIVNGVAFTPSVSASFTVVGTNTLTGCSSTNTSIQSVTVNALPVISVNSGSICNGQSFTMTPAGASTYTFSNGSAIVTPTADASYSVTGTSTAGCLSSTAAVSSITVNTLPVVTANTSNSVVCEGSLVSLTGSGADTYTWTGAVTNGVAFTPTVTDSYSVTGTNTLTGCTSTNVAAASVTVNANPVIAAASGAICNNGTFTITPNGANTYTISGGSAVVSPSTTTSYSVTGTSLEGCTGNTAVVTVSVQSSLTVSIAGSNTVCDGQAVSLTANGAATYTWNNGAVSNTIAPTPTVNTTYSVTGSSGTCSNSAVISVTVNSTPTVSAVSNTSLICSGQTVSLTASGAVTYTWSTNATGANITDTPTTSTTYTVTGADVNGCSNSATVFQNVSVCTDVKSVSNYLSQIEMYPNPTTGMVTVKLNSNAQIIIVNTVGQVIANELMTEGKRDFDITPFANGIYFVKVIANGNQQTFKLIKE
ncbi:MAG: hypothetical protein JWO32_3126 [Bacteroidetes bacterium]|nr:hypothetical protein [Bacteroidota bacterium]